LLPLEFFNQNLSRRFHLAALPHRLEAERKSQENPGAKSKETQKSAELGQIVLP